MRNCMYVQFMFTLLKVLITVNNHLLRNVTFFIVCDNCPPLFKRQYQHFPLMAVTTGINCDMGQIDSVKCPYMERGFNLHMPIEV